jgi:hypothetical protein
MKLAMSSFCSAVSAVCPESNLVSVTMDAPRPDAADSVSELTNANADIEVAQIAARAKVEILKFIKAPLLLKIHCEFLTQEKTLRSRCQLPACFLRYSLESA